ncbi:MAG: hypothetical protein GY838_00595, partial [bacterium]|nr:hypothetical protein [bacterium]
IQPEFGPAPEFCRPDPAPQATIRLAIRLVREDPARAGGRPVTGLLLIPDELLRLVHLRDLLPWSVSSAARLARFANIAFIVLEEGAIWDLPFGLPFAGSLAEGVLVVRGWRPSPEVPATVLRRAVPLKDGEVGFFTPARVWAAERATFRPVPDLLRIDRTIGVAHLTMDTARLERELVLPPIGPEPPPADQDAVALPEGPDAPGEADPSVILRQARAREKAGAYEEAGVLYERAGCFRDAAKAYQRAVEGT